MNESVPPILSVNDVKRFMNHPDVIIVDARGGADAYKRYEDGHLKGAIFMDLETDLSQKGADAAQGGRHPLPDPRTFGSLLGKVGISPSNHVLVYDDKAGANAAARFWWMMKALGHQRIQVIDGGLAALRSSGLPISSGASEIPGKKSLYPVQSWGLPTADMETVEKGLRDQNSLVIDVREGYRYRGESEPIDLVAGHIPGAVNIPYLDNLEPDGKFKSAETLRKEYKTLTENPKYKDVIVHCGSGVTACHTLLAMDLAGLTGASVYVGSWSEWSRNEKPIAIGEKT